MERGAGFAVADDNVAAEASDEVEHTHTTGEGVYICGQAGHQPAWSPPSCLAVASTRIHIPSPLNTGDGDVRASLRSQTTYSVRPHSCQTYSVHRNIMLQVRVESSNLIQNCYC